MSSWTCAWNSENDRPAQRERHPVNSFVLRTHPPTPFFTVCGESMAWHLSYVWAIRISAGRINGGVADMDMIALDVDCIATELCMCWIALDWETSVRAGYKFELNCILWVASRSTFAMVWKIGFFGLSGYYVDCIFCGLHWIESFLFPLNCIGSRSRIKSRRMDIDWIATELDWIGLEIRRGSVGEIRSRAKTRISQMSTTAGRQFFLEVFKS